MKPVLIETEEEMERVARDILVQILQDAEVYREVEGVISNEEIDRRELFGTAFCYGVCNVFNAMKSGALTQVAKKPHSKN